MEEGDGKYEEVEMPLRPRGYITIGRLFSIGMITNIPCIAMAKKVDVGLHLISQSGQSNPRRSMRGRSSSNSTNLKQIHLQTETACSPPCSSH